MEETIDESSDVVVEEETDEIRTDEVAQPSTSSDNNKPATPVKPKVKPEVVNLESTFSFIPNFKVPERVVEAKNEPIKIADVAVAKEERIAPQITNIGITADGLVTIDFSKAMMYPANWVAKYLKDAGLMEVDSSLIDKISTPEV